MNASPLTTHPLSPRMRIERVLIAAFAVLAIGLTIAIAGFTDSGGSHTTASTGSAAGRTLMHFYGTGAAPMVRAAQPQGSSAAAGSRHFYGLGA